MRILIFILFYCSSVFAQTGIAYQAVISNPDQEELPGHNNVNSFLSDQKICLRFTISSNTSIDYQEIIKTETDKYGIVNIIIGNGTPTLSNKKFELIDWSVFNKNLRVELDVSGECLNFIEISSGPFTFIPYSYSALNSVTSNPLISSGTATKITYDQKGLILKGETATTDDIIETSNKFFISSIERQKLNNLSGVNTGDETNLTIRQKLSIENVSFPNKGTLVAKDDLDFFSTLPISTAVQSSLNTKENTTNKSSASSLGISDILFPTQNAVKTYVDTNVTTLTNAITEEATTARAAEATNVTAIALKEDAANKTIDVATDGTSDVKFPSAKAVKTYADAKVVDGIADAVTTSAPTQNAVFDALALKANLASPTFTGTVSGIDKTMVGLGNVDNTKDADKPISDATQTALDAKANALDVTTSLALKEDAANKTNDVATDGTSEAKFPSAKAVKTYADAKVVDGIADAVTTSAPTQNAVFDALALKANLDSPTFTGTVTAPFFNGDGSGLTNIFSTTSTNTVNSNITNDITITTPVYPTFVSDVSGNLPLKVANSKLSFVPSTGSLTATTFNGDLIGDASRAFYIMFGSAGEIPYQSGWSTTSFIPVGTSGQILKSNGTQAPSWVDLNSITVDVPEATETVKGGVKISGDLVGSTYDNLIIADNKVTSNKILNGNVTYSKIQNVSPNRILGNTSSSSESIQEVEVTGTGKVALNNSPSFINPTLGDATATSIKTTGLTLGYKEVSSNTYSVSSDDAHYIKFLTNSTIVTLPSAAGIAGRRFVFTANLKIIVFLAKSGETINNESAFTFAEAVKNSILVVFSDGANWIIESSKTTN